MIIRFAFALSAAMALSMPGNAQQRPLLDENATRVTLDRAIDLAIGRSPQMAQSEQAVVNSGESARTAWGAFLPTISSSSSMSIRSSQRFDAATDRVVSGSSNSYNAGLTAGYTLFQGGRRFSELGRVKSDVRAAEARRDDQRFGVIFQTNTFFFTALRQDELLTVALRRIDQATQSLDMTRAQAQVGEATASDTLRARLELINARQAVLNAETATRAARFALGHQIGVSEPVIPDFEGDIDPRPLALSIDEMLTLAESQSPSVVASEAARAAAQQAIWATKTAYIPTLSFSSGYDWTNQTASFNGGSTSWRLNFNLNYPLFNGFTRESNVVRAQYTARVARLQEDDARLAAHEDADAAIRALETAERSIDIAQDAVAVADEDLRVTRERYRFQVAIILDVITSQVASDQARVDLVNARYDYVLARAELEAILGRGL